MGTFINRKWVGTHVKTFVAPNCHLKVGVCTCGVCVCVLTDGQLKYSSVGTDIIK